MTTAVRSVRVAVIQDAPVLFEVEPTLEKVAELSGRAATDGAQLAVFPEAFIGGYPKGLDFGAVVGSRTAEGREQFRRYWAGAIDVPGSATERLGQVAAETGLHLVIGVIERAGGTLYCTALFFGSDGELLGKHRKVMPTAMERLIWGFGDGSTMPVIDTPLGRIGAVICWENYMPLMRAAMYAKGIELYCAPTADDRDIWQATVRHIAREGRCFVLSACQFLRRGDCPEDYPVEAADDEVLMGCLRTPLDNKRAPIEIGRIGPAQSEASTHISLNGVVMCHVVSSPGGSENRSPTSRSRVPPSATSIRTDPSRTNATSRRCGVHGTGPSTLVKRVSPAHTPSAWTSSCIWLPGTSGSGSQSPADVFETNTPGYGSIFILLQRSG